jgi:transcriptional regulator with XRE-family HTH domain
MEKSTHTTEYLALRAELLAARKNADLSQRDLAAILAVPHSWVAKVESGERRIDLIEFCWFLSACGADPLVATERLMQKLRAPRTKVRTKQGGSK